MKALTITQMILRVAALCAVILGIIFWANPSFYFTNKALINIHMLLGIIVVLSLWVIGFLQGRLKGGNFGLALGTFVIGLIVAIVGLFQHSWKDAGVNVELINGIHLLLGIIAVGFGEMIGGRVKRAAKVAAA
ncbi:MAG TPA: hypothetical protein VF458_13015 [Ktedonobacteraceae bacterium]